MIGRILVCVLSWLSVHSCYISDELLLRSLDEGYMQGMIYDRFSIGDTILINDCCELGVYPMDAVITRYTDNKLLRKATLSGSLHCGFTGATLTGADVFFAKPLTDNEINSAQYVLVLDTAVVDKYGNWEISGRISNDTRLFFALIGFVTMEYDLWPK